MRSRVTEQMVRTSMAFFSVKRRMVRTPSILTARLQCVIYKGGCSIYKGACVIYKGGCSILKGACVVYKGGCCIYKGGCSTCS